MTAWLCFPKVSLGSRVTCWWAQPTLRYCLEGYNALPGVGSYSYTCCRSFSTRLTSGTRTPEPVIGHFLSSITRQPNRS